PRGRRAVLRQRPDDGLRADGNLRARRDRGGERQARDKGVPAAAGAIRLETMADVDHARARPRHPRRTEVNRVLNATTHFLLDVIVQPVSLMSKMIPSGSLNLRSKPSSPSSPRSKKNLPPAASIAACPSLR